MSQIAASLAVPPATKIDPNKCRAPRGDTVRDFLYSRKGPEVSRRLSARRRSFGKDKTNHQEVGDEGMTGGGAFESEGNTARIHNWIKDAGKHQLGSSGESGEGGDSSEGVEETTEGTSVPATSAAVESALESAVTSGEGGTEMTEGTSYLTESKTENTGTTGQQYRSSFDAAMHSEDTENTHIATEDLRGIVQMMPRRGGASEFGGEKDNATVVDTDGEDMDEEEEEEEEYEEGTSVADTDGNTMMTSVTRDGSKSGADSRATGSYMSQATGTETMRTGTTDSFTLTTNSDSMKSAAPSAPRTGHIEYQREAPHTFQTNPETYRTGPDTYRTGPDTYQRGPDTFQTGTTYGGRGASTPGGGTGGFGDTFRSYRSSFGSSFAGQTFGSLLDRFFKKDIMVIAQIIVRRWKQMLPHIRWFFRQLVAFFSGLAHLRRAIAAFITFLRKDERTRQLVDRIALASTTTIKVLLIIITAIYEGIIFSHWMIKNRAIPFFQENIPKCYNAVMKKMYKWAEESPWVAMLGPFSLSFAIHEDRLPPRFLAVKRHVKAYYRRPETSYLTRAMKTMSRAASTATGYGTGTEYYTSGRTTTSAPGIESEESSTAIDRSGTSFGDSNSKADYFDESSSKYVSEPTEAGSSVTPSGSVAGSDVPPADPPAPPAESNEPHTIGRKPLAAHIFKL